MCSRYTKDTINSKTNLKELYIKKDGFWLFYGINRNLYYIFFVSDLRSVIKLFYYRKFSEDRICEFHCLVIMRF